MATVDTVLENLNRYGIDDTTLGSWESELGLTVPVDEYGRKQYSPHHINLFKNVKKHLALGRTLDDIRQIISLPPTHQSKPEPQPVTNAHTNGVPVSPTPRPSTYASSPVKPELSDTGYSTPVSGISSRPQASSQASQESAMLNQLVERLMGEKDQLQNKLVEAEKLNSHLYNANTMFHKKMKTMTQQLEETQEQLKVQNSEEFQVKMLDDKAKLHKQLLENEKLHQLKDRELDQKRQELMDVREQLEELQDRLRGRILSFDPQLFCGEWLENGKLIEIPFDNFGINIENHRTRRFRLSAPPTFTMGNTAVITTHYEYENNPLWKRIENIFMVYVDDNQLEGQLNVDYILDNVPVARAVYQVTCNRVLPIQASSPLVQKVQKDA